MLLCSTIAHANSQQRQRQRQQVLNGSDSGPFRLGTCWQVPYTTAAPPPLALLIISLSICISLCLVPVMAATWVKHMLIYVLINVDAVSNGRPRSACVARTGAELCIRAQQCDACDQFSGFLTPLCRCAGPLCAVDEVLNAAAVSYCLCSIQNTRQLDMYQEPCFVVCVCRVPQLVSLGVSLMMTRASQLAR